MKFLYHILKILHKNLNILQTYLLKIKYQLEILFFKYLFKYMNLVNLILVQFLNILRTPRSNHLLIKAFLLLNSSLIPSFDTILY